MPPTVVRPGRSYSSNTTPLPRSSATAASMSSTVQPSCVWVPDASPAEANREKYVVPQRYRSPPGRSSSGVRPSLSAYHFFARSRSCAGRRAAASLRARMPPVGVVTRCPPCRLVSARVGSYQPVSAREAGTIGTAGGEQGIPARQLDPLAAAEFGGELRLAL